MTARKVRRPPRRARSSGAVASPQHTEDYVITLPALEGEKPEDWDNRRFGTLGSRRLQRDLVRQLFIDKAKRTPRRKRR
jgi:hypothetical protein